MNLVDAESISDMNGVALRCYSGNPITTVAMKNTNDYAVRVDFINGTVASEILLLEGETRRFDFAMVQCNPSLVVLRRVTRA